MRLTLALALLSTTACLAADYEVYQVRGKLAVVETDSRPGLDGEPVEGATRFLMVLEPEGTLDYQRAEGSEFKPLFDEIVASSRRNVRPGTRDANGDWVPFREDDPASPGHLIQRTLTGDEERLEFFAFTGKLRLRQDYDHPWANERSHHIVGEVCLETVEYQDEGWARPKGGCDLLLLPD
jgi:hypothetical protein